DTNGGPDVFEVHLSSGTIRKASVAGDGRQSDGDVGHPTISSDGRYVGFHSSSHFVPAEPGGWSMYVQDRDQDRGRSFLARVSVSEDGSDGRSDPGPSGISDDGRYAVFTSSAPGLVPDDGNGLADVFVHDRLGGTTERLSTRAGGGDASAPSYAGAISADGRFVAFVSEASDVTPGDANDRADVFVTDRGPDLGVSALEISRSGRRLGVSGSASFAPVMLQSAWDTHYDVRPYDTAVGGQILWGDLAYRPESDELLARIRLASLPWLRSKVDCPAACPGGLPVMIYGAVFLIGGRTFEARAIRSVSTESKAQDRFELLRCSGWCQPVGTFRGSIGSSGYEVNLLIPTASLGLGPGRKIDRVQLFARLAPSLQTGPYLPAMLLVDDVMFYETPIPGTSVELGIAPAGADVVEYTVPAIVEAGRFEGSFDVARTPPGRYDVWTKVCAATCAETRTPHELEGA
ncbi:MAG TPA: hypothetical protein VM638_08735, partial [Actinomycetota bacterium]|nr:hypothetical protein [Actinomycetota bacterium]